MLDKYSVYALLKQNNYRFINKLLQNKNLDHTLKYIISLINDSSFRWKLLRDHELDHDTKYSIAFYGTHGQKIYILRNHRLDEFTKAIIFRNGNEELREILRTELGFGYDEARRIFRWSFNF